MTWFSSIEGNKCLWHNMDVMHTLLHAEISMEKTVKERKNAKCGKRRCQNQICEFLD